MAKTITVAPGPKCDPGQVALWEQHPDHPDGEVFIAAPPAGKEPDEVEVARTPEVSKRLSDGRLVEVEPKPKATAPDHGSGSAPAQRHPTAGPGEVIPGVTEAQQRALVAAGYVTADDIRKASDADLLKVDGVGPATVAALREATKE